jgi:RHS repeat-associated protein
VVNGANGPVSYTLGNGLNVYLSYDGLGRPNGRWVCNGPAAQYCSGGTQIYGTNSYWHGSQMQGQADTLNDGVTYGYDGFNRLTSRTVTAGTVQNYTYAYDRYGNRVSQTPLQGGYSFNPTINAANNQITTSGYTYDAAGNMTSDTVHSYTYDAEGNITKVDGGSTAQYVYDVFNQRIHVQTASATNEYVYDPMGRRVSTWLSPNNYGSEGRIYWGDGQQIAYRSIDGTTYFDHQDMLGTERMRTNYGGSVGSSYHSLPWGDGYTATVNNTGADQDNLHFAGLDRDAESGTEHAQFRNYASAQGRWLAPDPYVGSYALSNPQSMNRYAYALNNPTSAIDPSGLADCIVGVYDPNCGGSVPGGDGGDGTYTISVTTWTGTPYDADQVSLDDPIPRPTSDRGRGTTGNAPNNIPAFAAPSTDVCTAAGAVAGASAGALIGGGIGEGAGALVGGGVGTLFAPGVGTVGGAILGGGGGATAGATVGATIGGALGGIVGNILCSKGGPRNILPSWAEGQRPNPGESASQFAKRLCDARYGPGNYPAGPGSEYNLILKWARYKFGI